MGEKLQILSMVKDGTITIDEGVNLLDALDNKGNTSTVGNFVGRVPKWLKIKVVDSDQNTKVNIRFPISLLNLGVKLVARFAPEIKEIGLTDSDLDEIFRAVRNGETGKIIDIDGGESGKVEVIIE